MTNTLKALFYKVWTPELKKRLKAFAWHTGMMTLAFGIDQAAKSLGVLEMPEQVTVLLGLALAQASKYVRNAIAAKDMQG